MDVFPSPQTPYDTKGPLRRRELKYVIPGSKETVTNIVKLLTKATTKQTCSGFAEPLMARLYMTLNSPCASGQWETLVSTNPVFELA